MQNSGHLSADRWRTHSARTNNISKIVATFVYASSQGQRTHSARTIRKLHKIVATFVYASSQGQRMHSARTNFPI
jgi:hypothetical protein